MRIVLDTNVLISGLLWRGPPHELLERARAGWFTIVTSPALVREFDLVIHRRKLRAVLDRSNIDAARLLRELHRLVEIADAPPLPRRVSRDPADDEVLAAAIAMRADLIVSGDADLLTIRCHDGIAIVDPAVALTRIRQ